MADKQFRVLLDLTDLHLKSLKYVWMNVSPQDLKTIADFKTTVIHKINLDIVDIKLFVRNGLLLDNETVMILREDDTVKVHYQDQYQSDYNQAENCAKESKKSSRKRNSESYSDSPSSAKKCKTDIKIVTQGNDVEMSNKKKKKHKQSPFLCSENPCDQSKTFEVRNHHAVNFHNKDEKQTLAKNITDVNLLQKCDSFYSFDNEDSTVDENKSKTCKTDIIVGSNNCLKLDSTNDSLSNTFGLVTESRSKNIFDVNAEVKKSEGLGNNCPKKKRKRHKKRKQELKTAVDTFDSTVVNREFKSLMNEADESVQRKHIIYSSSPSKKEEVIQLDCDDKNEKVKNLTIDTLADESLQRKHVIYSSSSSKKEEVIQLDCDDKNENAKNLIIDTFVMGEGVSKIKVKPNNYPKISTPAQSNVCKTPNWCVSRLQSTDLNSHYNETVGFKEGKSRSYVHTKYADKECVSFDNPKNIKKTSEVCYTDLPALNSRPNIGAHIAYKILELDEHYSPVISNYREGIVKNINFDNEEMEIELLKHEIKPGRTGKFENLKEDEIPLPEIKRCDIVRWSALVEPKLISC